MGNFQGFLPVNKTNFPRVHGVVLSCGIVGLTVMPHSLYLGSALVQPRLKDYDEKHGVLKINDSQKPAQ